MTAILSSLHIFPIKSCAAYSLQESQVEPRGLRDDRRWMLVDSNGQFITGRQQPRLTLVHTKPFDAALKLTAPEMPPLLIPTPNGAAPRIAVTVWKNAVDAQLANDQAHAWFSHFLGQNVQLVYMDDQAKRLVDTRYAQSNEEVSFADGFPLLLISQTALDQLNSKLAQPINMLRFRPNLVVTGTPPHAEDSWKRIRIGALEFAVVKPCTRCIFTTVDYERGEFAADGEPLKTLIQYRRGPHGVSFGQNIIPRSHGKVNIGDRIRILE